MLALLLIGCAALSPQVFAPDVQPWAESDRIAALPGAAPVASEPARTASSPSPLALAAINARKLQERYVASALSLSNSNAGIAASLLGIGTLGGIKAVSNPVPRDIAGLGVALGGLFTYGNTMVSLPRAKAYVAGALALECAVESAAATDFDALDVASMQAKGEQTQLREAIHRLEVWQRPDVITVTRDATTSSCSELPSCKSELTTGSQEDRSRRAALCKATQEHRTRNCAPASKSEVTVQAHKDVVATLNWAREVRTALQNALESAAQSKPHIDLAANTLRGRTRAIEAAVFTEVAKTEPDLNAIKTAAASIGDVGTSLIPRITPPPAPAADGSAGPALSSNTVLNGQAIGSQERPVGLDGVVRKVAAISDTVANLTDAQLQFDERARRAKLLEACSAPGGQRPVTYFVETPRAQAAPVPLDENLRKRLAPALGKDPAKNNVEREVTQALADCQQKGRIVESGAGGSLQQSTIVAITLGRCTAP